VAGLRPAEHEPVVPKHGGCRKLKTFQLARLVYDVTVRFCNRYVDRGSRTHDQMVQAARSGVQNIAEASQGSGTSRKMEMKLTNVARASLEELRLDYQDYLRQRDLPEWPPDHPGAQALQGPPLLQPGRGAAVGAGRERTTTRTATDAHGRRSRCRGRPWRSVFVRAAVSPCGERRAVPPERVLPPAGPAGGGPGCGFRGGGRLHGAPLPRPPRPARRRMSPPRRGPFDPCPCVLLPLHRHSSPGRGAA
jgi:four helix bundle protein